MNDQDRRNLLLKLLKRNQSEATRRAIYELFAQWPEGAEKEKSLVFADQALDAWDDRLRHIDSSWGWLYDSDKLASVARLARAMSIYRREQYGSRDLWAIANSEHVRNLRYLTIVRSEVSSAAIKALSESPYLANLMHLEIRRTVLGDDIEYLLRSRAFPNLKTLKLIDVCALRHRLHLISQSIPFSNLSEIDLSENSLWSEGAAILSQAPWLRSIEKLELRENGIHDGSIIALARSPYIQSLKTLDLSKNPITEAGKESLLEIAREKRIRLIV